jgi:hypothetical protein
MVKQSLAYDLMSDQIICIGKHDKVCFSFGGGKHIFAFVFELSFLPKGLVMVPSYRSFFYNSND